MKINLKINQGPHPGQTCEEAHPGEPCSDCAHMKENLNFENAENIQDPIGGTIRPDQLRGLIEDDLKQCLYFVQNEQWSFQSLLRNVALRVKVYSEFHNRSDMEG